MKEKEEADLWPGTGRDKPAACPTEKFTGLAGVYSQGRPDYPAEALDFLERHGGLGLGAVVVDVGAGTGISSRWLARKDWQVIGVEPNQEMRRRARTDSASAGKVTFREGTGETTGLANESADLVLCAQAFHWLKAETALAEFERILKPGGWVALLWNERDARDPFSADFGRIIRANPESVRTEDRRQRAYQAFLASPRFEDKSCSIFPHGQRLNEDGLLSRALSMSHVPREGSEHEELVRALRECFRRWQDAGEVVMRYQTSVYLGRKGTPQRNN